LCKPNRGATLNLVEGIQFAPLQEVPPVPTSTPSAQAYPELDIAFNHFNHELFQGRLPHPLFVLHRSDRARGHFSKARFLNRLAQLADEMMLNAGLFTHLSIEDTMSTLVHEMTHQLQRHFGKASRRGYHNREFAKLMLKIGLCPSDTGLPGGAQTGEHMTHYIIAGGPFQQSCARLLALHPGIVWFDRVMVRQPPRPSRVFAAGDLGPTPEDPGDAPSISEGPDEPGHTDAAGPVAGLASPLGKPQAPPMAEPTPPLASSVRGLEVVDPPQKANRSLRVKFVCPHPECATAVWGKPSTQVDCSKHKLLMVDSSAVEEPAVSPAPLGAEAANGATPG